MSLDDLRGAAQIAPKIPATRPSAPTGFEPGLRYDGGYSPEHATFTTPPLERNVQGDPAAWNDLCAELGFTVPDGYVAQLSEARFDPFAWTRETAFVEPDGDDEDGRRRKTPATTRPAWRYKFRLVARADLPEQVDVAALLATARGNRAPIPRRKARGRDRIVAAGDGQIGKTGSLGGVAEWLARFDSLTHQLDELCIAEPCDEAVLADPGDLLEGFENVAAQQFTNDLSHPQQLDLARHVVTHLVTTIAKHHRHTRVVTVPSNHGAWRRGKDRLGRAGDDYGLSVYRAVADALARDPQWRKRVTFILPDRDEISLALKVRDDVLGIAHGDAAGSRPDAVPAWWAKQTHGDQPLAAASILVTGHWHHFRMQPVGAINGRARWWIQAPTLDNGSDWWRHLSGEHDAPGLVTFTIPDGGGWDNLRRLTA